MPNLRHAMMGAAGVSTAALHSIYGWGRNDGGYLGDGTTTNRSSPVQMGDKSDWTSIDLQGNQGTGAVNSAGELWVWGGNAQGQLGLGDTTSRSSPTQVGSLTDWAWIHSAQTTSGAVKTDGTLWTWGGAGTGQLGNGTDTPDISSPIQIGSLTNWSKTNGSNTQLLALKTDGTLWAWGSGGEGRLGLGDTTNRSSPTQIGSLTDWDDVNSIQAAGSAIKTDGTLWTWGANSQGECGNGGTTTTSSPAQVGSLTDWVDLSGSFQCMFGSRSA